MFSSFVAVTSIFWAATSTLAGFSVGASMRKRSRSQLLRDLLRGSKHVWHQWVNHLIHDSYLGSIIRPYNLFWIFSEWQPLIVKGLQLCGMAANQSEKDSEMATVLCAVKIFWKGRMQTSKHALKTQNCLCRVATVSWHRMANFQRSRHFVKQFPMCIHQISEFWMKATSKIQPGTSRKCCDSSNVNPIGQIHLPHLSFWFIILGGVVLLPCPESRSFQKTERF